MPYETDDRRRDIRFQRAVKEYMENSMSTFADLATAQATLDTEITQVGTDVTALLAKVGTLDPASQTALDAEVIALGASTTALTGIDPVAKP